MDGLDLVRRRMRVQGLTGKPFAKPVDVVRSLGAVQAQEFAEVKWSLGERVRGHDDAAVERAFADGEIFRTHALRPTWHFVAAEDIRWILALTGPRLHAANRYPYRRFELDDALLARTDDSSRRRSPTASRAPARSSPPRWRTPASRARADSGSHTSSCTPRSRP